MTGTEMTPYAAAPLSERMEYAQTLAQAGDLIPRGLMYQPRNPETNAASGPLQPSPGKIMLVMETGAMLGLHPIAALQGIHVIEGKASLSASTMSAVVRQAGHDLKVWTEGSVSDGTFKAHAKLIRAGDTFEYTSTWDIDRATRAKLTGKDNWKNYFEAMAKARAISDVCRDGASDALAGVIYTPDELEAETNAQGEPYESSAPHEEPAAKPARKRATNGTQGTRRKTSTAGAPTSVPMEDAPAAPAEDIVDAEVVDEAAEAEEADRLERERIAAEQEAAERAKDEPPQNVTHARAADALDGESEVDYQRRKRDERKAASDRELELGKAEAAKITEPEPEPEPQPEPEPEPEPQFVDPQTQEVYDTEAEMLAAMKARVQAKQAAREAEEQPPADEPWPTDDDAPASEWELAQAERDDDQPGSWARLARAAINQVQLRSVWDEATAAGKMDTTLRSIIVDLKPTLPEG